MKYLIYVLILLMLCAGQNFAQETVSYFIVSWSPNGKYVSFTELRHTGPMNGGTMKADICIAKADGTGELKKITGDEGKEFGATWSKDGKRIFFGSSRDEKKSDIFSIKPDGTGLLQITKDGTRNSAPEINGKRIVFNAESVEHKPQVYTMNSDGSDIKALTNDNTLAFYNPVWSPNGKKIVYYVEKGDRKDQIWVMNADGSNKTLLTGNIAHNFYPSWSADGKRIVFCSDRGGQPAIYTMNADGTDIKRLAGVDSFYLRYSPDGKKIAFINGQFPNTNVIIADADGSNQVNITAKK